MANIPGITPLERFEDLMAHYRSERNQPGFNPADILNRLAELFEEQINLYYHVDPDPLDERHPQRIQSNCNFGILLRQISGLESFLDRLTGFLCSSDDPRNPTVRAAARLLCCIEQGVTISVTSSDADATVNTLYKIALSDVEPTNCYALLIISSILDSEEQLIVTKQRNIELVSCVMKRLAAYTEILDQEIAKDPTPIDDSDFRRRLGSFCLEPLNVETKLRLSMTYLSSLADYQDIMPHMYDAGVMKYIYLFMQPKYSSRDIRITFDALRLLSNLLCHRCIHLEFVESEGLELLMEVPRPSVASSVVSLVLYYAAYIEDAVERMCNRSTQLLEKIMSYTLWLVECSHPSARCYALYFLNITLCYGVFYRLFVLRNGLRYLFNALCVLPIRLTDDKVVVQKDSACWQVVRASLLTMRRYLDISLLLWIDSLDSSLAGVFDEHPKLVLAAGDRLVSYTTEQMNRLISLVVSRMRPPIEFQPIQELNKLGAIPVLFRIIARNVYAYAKWPGRSECTRLSVDVLNIMCISTNLAESIAATEVYSFPLSGFISRRRSHLEIVISDGGSSDDNEETTLPNQQPQNRQDGTPTPVEPSTANSTQAAGRNESSVRGSLFVWRPGAVPGDQYRIVDHLADEPASEDHVNGLHMLITMIHDDDNWDVAVQKAVLSFIGTLVYRPIDEREHPDQPVLAASIMSQNAVGLSESILATPRNPNSTAYTSSSDVCGSCRKRRRDEISSNSDNGEDSLRDYSKVFALATPESTRPQRIGLDKSGASTSNMAALALLQHQAQLWRAVRRQHGLMLLLHELDVTEPISEADSIRTLACRGLVGLARSEEVRSMLAKLPLFTKSQLQLLMKEPILQDRIVEHAEFCRYAVLLMRLVLGGSLSDGSLTDGDMSMDRVRRAAIVARTRIQWDDEELLEIICHHLRSKGLHKSAAALEQEAHLRLGGPVPHQLPLFGHDGDSDSEVLSPPAPRVSTASASAASSAEPSTPSLRLCKPQTPSSSLRNTPKPFRERLDRTPCHRQQLLPSQINSPMLPSVDGAISTTTGSGIVGPTGAEGGEMTLSRIVESFLMHQHAQCSHPLSVCPRFSLHHPHRCPEPRDDSWFGRISGGPSLVAARETVAGCHRMRCSPQRFIRRYIHSRFMPVSTLVDLEDDVYTAAAFGRGSTVGFNDDGLFLGTSSGAVRWVKVEEGGLPVEVFRSHSSSIRQLEHSRDGRRLIVCAEYDQPSLHVAHLQLRDNTECGNSLSASNPFYSNPDRPVFTLESVQHAEFNHSGWQNMIVATCGKMAKIFDLTTSDHITDLFSSVKQSEYLRNKATFSMDDNLVLNDGVVWDIRCAGATSSCRPVHKIDKFQDIISGVFHPNGLEIVVGSAVWDMRTWRLLHTVQALDKLETIFSENGEIIYAGSFGMDVDDPLGERGRTSMQSMFRTLDAIDYSLIASVDVKHHIDQLAVDRRGMRLALVERLDNKNSSESFSQCRIYSIGRKRGEREFENDEDENEAENNRHSDNDDDDDDEDDDMSGTSSSTSAASEDLDDSDESASVGSDAEANSESSSTTGSQSSWETEVEMEVSQEEAEGEEEEGGAGDEAHS